MMIKTHLNENAVSFFNVSQSDNNCYQKYFDFSKDQSNLPLMDTSYSYVKNGARNEVSLLKSVYKHPDVYSANSMSSQKHQIVAVFDDTTGSKATVIARVDDVKKRPLKLHKPNDTDADHNDINDSRNKDVSV